MNANKAVSTLNTLVKGDFILSDDALYDDCDTMNKIMSRYELLANSYLPESVTVGSYLYELVDIAVTQAIINAEEGNDCIIDKQLNEANKRIQDLEDELKINSGMVVYLENALNNAIAEIKRIKRR